MPTSSRGVSGASEGAGWTALAEGRWASARGAFEGALTHGETPEAFEGLSWAAWWLDDAEAVFEARERAFRGYRTRGDRASAARVATWLAVDHLDFHGAFAVANGWLRRAHRLLEEVEGGPEHGWLAFHEGYLAFASGDTSQGIALASRALEAGRSSGVADLEMLGLALQGAALVARARVEEGMACLDEATTLALEGDATVPISAAWTCCLLVSSCEQVRDYARAFQWCDHIADFAERYDSRYMLGFCRTHYGTVHLLEGKWMEAEARLLDAIDAYSRSRPPYVPEAVAGLAELRRRQGRWDDAARLLDEAGDGRQVLLCRARLALDRGDPARAAELGERALRRSPEVPGPARAPALEVLIRARARRGDLEGAKAALEELGDLGARVGTAPLRAAAHLGAGILAAASGEHDAARRSLEDAVDLFRRTGLPFEAAQARLDLAESLAALGDPQGAKREAEVSRETLTRLGAGAEARRARVLVEGRGVRAGDAIARSGITKREREVLRLLAEGLTNREIARRLVISEHTVHRHVANIRRKLGVSSRTAAVARAAGSGLLGSTDG